MNKKVLKSRIKVTWVWEGMVLSRNSHEKPVLPADGPGRGSVAENLASRTMGLVQVFIRHLNGK